MFIEANEWAAVFLPGGDLPLEEVSEMLCEVESSLEICWHEALAEVHERRCQRRTPFLREGLIMMHDDQPVELPVLCRDISRDGIGLLHASPLQEGSSFTLHVSLLGQVLELPCETVWCRPASDGCYFSGSRYQCATTPQAWMLLSAVLSEKLYRRLSRRIPYARPVMLVDSRGMVHDAFCRDISRTGIGLLHRRFIQPGSWVVTIPAAPSARIGRVVARVDIHRCRAVGQGWHASGGTFVDIQMEIEVESDADRWSATDQEGCRERPQ